MFDEMRSFNATLSQCSRNIENALEVLAERATNLSDAGFERSAENLFEAITAVKSNLKKVQDGWNEIVFSDDRTASVEALLATTESLSKV